MAHRPYPSRERALHQHARHEPIPVLRLMSEAHGQVAKQGAVALKNIAAAARPIRDSLVQAGAPPNAPLAQQMLVAIAPHCLAEAERSAPGVLRMVQAARQMRSGR